MSETANDVFHVLKGKRFDLNDEKRLQEQMHSVFTSRFLPDEVQREYHLDKKSIIDFFICNHLGIEVKIKGSKREIYKQCERYCQFESVKEFILVTNRIMGFPKQINGKDCYLIKLGTAWL